MARFAQDALYDVIIPLKAQYVKVRKGGVGSLFRTDLIPPARAKASFTETHIIIVKKTELVQPTHEE